MSEVDNISSSTEDVTLDDFDFINLIIYDVHGFSKGRTVSRKSMSSVIKAGTGLYSGICYFGMQGQATAYKDFAEKSGFGNKSLKPWMSTLRRCQGSARGERRIGEVLCYLTFPDGTMDRATPRETALLQVDTLQKEFGLTLKSSFELEFMIRHKDSNNYYGHSVKWADISVMECCHDVLMDLVDDMKEGGIEISTMVPEYGVGQFEFTFEIGQGIQTADDVAKFKNSTKAFLNSKGLNRVFMTCPEPGNGCSNGFHYNLSLWTQDGRNALLDPSQPNKLSTLGQHFLAGLVEHAPALTALCCPTINCYRRIGAAWAPLYANWGIGDRMATYRLKLEEGDNIYIENRLPSSACNSHLVLAANLAAGMDGIRRKLPLPKPREETTMLPRTLEDALVTLEKDNVLIGFLGEKMIEYFLDVKRTFEIELFKAHSKLPDGEKIEKEKEMYYHSL